MKTAHCARGRFIAAALSTFVFAVFAASAATPVDGTGTSAVSVPTYFENGTLSVAVGSAAVFGSSGCRGACEAALIAHGFRRLRRHEVALDISNDFLGWVGLNTGNYATHVKVNPFVGIHCIPLMRMIANLESQKYRVGSVATYAVHLGELVPALASFQFTSDSDTPAQAAGFATAVSEHGVCALWPALRRSCPCCGSE